MRLAKIEEIDKIMDVYEKAKIFMRDNGNPNQWYIPGNPKKEAIKERILKKELYVAEDQDKIYLVFALIIGIDDTYLKFYDGGSWINDLPYGTIHSLASDNSHHKVFEECLEFCFNKINNIKIDTHKDNSIMLHILEKNGFTRCGIIHLKNGEERIAFQKTKI